MSSYQFRPVPECQIMRRELSSSEKELFLSACLTYNSVSVDIPLALSNVSPQYKNVTQVYVYRRYIMLSYVLSMMTIYWNLCLQICRVCQVWNKVIGLLVIKFKVIFRRTLYFEKYLIFLTFQIKMWYDIMI